MNQIKTMLLILCLIPAFGHAQTNTQHSSGVSELSNELRVLFTQEMVALKKGLVQITEAYIAGDWATIETIALKMEQSYILRQNLSKQQMHQLHSVLSPEFIKQDVKFHYLSGMLNHAAKMEKVEMIGFYLSKMSETCVSCHSQYAVNKFPLFKTETNTNGHH